MAILDIHLDFPRGARDVGQIGRSFRPHPGVARQIEGRGTHCTDNRPDRQHTKPDRTRSRTAIIVVQHTGRSTKCALAERDEEQEQR